MSAPRTVPIELGHDWEAVRAAPIAWVVPGGQRYHESLLRSFRVLGRVREMLERHDSPETILAFIDFCSGPNDTRPFKCGTSP